MMTLLCLVVFIAVLYGVLLYEKPVYYRVEIRPNQWVVMSAAQYDAYLERCIFERLLRDYIEALNNPQPKAKASRARPKAKARPKVKVVKSEAELILQRAKSIHNFESIDKSGQVRALRVYAKHLDNRRTPINALVAYAMKQLHKEPAANA